MSEVLARVQKLVNERKFALSDHAFDEASEDGILPLEIIRGVHIAVVIEDYPDARRGPSVLVLSNDEDGRPIHAVWGIHRDSPDKAVVITAYRPKSDLWTADFLRRVAK